MSNNKKQEYLHKYKLSLMRECIIYGKSFKETQIFFKSRGVSLSQSQYTRLKQELMSAKLAKNWFSKEALFVIEEDHQLSVERIRMIEDRLMQEFEQVASTSFYNNWDIKKPNQKLTINKNHDGNYMLKLITVFMALQEIKTKMFGATPLVQELMDVHRQQEENENSHNYADRKLAS